MKGVTCLFTDNVDVIEDIYRCYQKDSNSVSLEWRNFFSNNLHLSENINAIDQSKSLDLIDNCNAKIVELLNFFRSYGHTAADLDPLKLHVASDLDYHEYIDLGDIKPSTTFNSVLGLHNPTLDDIINTLKSIYCNKLGYEFMHIRNHEERLWLQNKIESFCNGISNDEKKKILQHLMEVECFEQLLHTRYPGYKRFSVEGGDSLIVAIEQMIDLSAVYNFREIVIGMAHRGRLSVLTKVMKKPYRAMIYEFKGGTAYPKDIDVSGDVKYHLGYSSDRQLSSNKTVHLSLCPNPSHLESVNPVVMGKIRAKQDVLEECDKSSIFGVLVHGDASVIGQGVVAETLTLSNLAGYEIRGVVHIVVNNQIGFTTDPKDSRSSFYCSDVAKLIDAPVFHVNGDSPEDVVAAVKLAIEYREKFNKDVVIDIVCYRRYGHNEGDEPLFTQPVMYDCIMKHKTPMTLYKEQLISESVITEEEFKILKAKFNSMLNEEFVQSENYVPDQADWLKGNWTNFRRPVPGNFADYLSDTRVDEQKLLKLAHALVDVPKEFNGNKKILRVLSTRFDMVSSGENIDWATGEALAFASLLSENIKVRLSGQDCGRGTFSHRHAVLVDQVTGSTYIPLNNLGVPQASFEVLNSPLSEYAVMGFEYGYSTNSPAALVIWEGQFGDFANGAQIIVDQFISSAETKWLRCSGLVLLLPHGYEGQGPEHSSARIERYLQLCAEDNMQVVNCTTPASYFHVLRRQICRDFRKPLVVFTPKSLLRHKMAVSKLSDFAGSFIPVIGEVYPLCSNEKVRRVVICSGKVYFDIIEARDKRKIDNIAVIRLEQYYPFPEEQLANELRNYQNAEVVWCQEEPMNMGAWLFVNSYIEKVLMKINVQSKRPICVSRPASAATAAGYASMHSKEQDDVLLHVLS
ncbi:oxoglutarate dehydrogenase (succinyl-transferring), E1 component [Ehrlichia chaffeensis str. Heartland]|uniref:2-oxoglutarate dehydrogenase E1 component n=1 Tax=Ehrlichia chaffeensis (strain ATCC CRL-10679 / Arkansas) TaxID=205920 RepID=Q2GG05_EHRCR|nr:2-oxoglutarate dehydrogenase E1 component [Ehrlichia chaffeensis]ABD45486.1 2-oxoglutarate dehydrogenase, E1 component [Ehrlichia chaffeensis str. Arkansas]AHX03882.1 oxoglutarate dehydrogenase (succinyl-transferring), E1 component [Ehrlichia chaffeensis str. Heartland]AHX05391.1 oxoglutarate dehydrogenase (succinyl-transferring), E1 component [Ehrlichia chaffeensis str. Jax]AHX08252.1 oxoglutarate dehydrogenase (succinyl-transferring), E1 component [Ehrlichia chaffeensis str. Saint Vincent]